MSPTAKHNSTHATISYMTNKWQNKLYPYGNVQYFKCPFFFLSFLVAVQLKLASSISATAALTSIHSFPGELEELQSVLHFPEEVALRITDAEYQLFYQVSYSAHYSHYFKNSHVKSRKLIEKIFFFKFSWQYVD